VYRYRLSLEPHNRHWLPGLDTVTRWPAGRAFRTFDQQLVTQAPVTTLTAFQLESHTTVASMRPLSSTLRRADTALPDGGNPRSRALARELRERYADDSDLARAVLRKFREEQYFYTLEPPRLQQ